MKNLKEWFLHFVIYCADLLDLRFGIIQYRWGRKLFKGKYYLIICTSLPLTNHTFWSNEEITSCQSRTLCTEEH